MVGKFACDLLEIMATVERLGHLVSNHTYDHLDLEDCHGAGGDVVSQIARVDGLIRNWIDAPVVYFRAPYGSWSPDVAAAVNANLTVALSHVGPIGWDIDARDWDCWRSGTSPEDCAAAYLQAIEATGH